MKIVIAPTGRDCGSAAWINLDCQKIGLDKIGFQLINQVLQPNFT